jgi:hypothetical protein
VLLDDLHILQTIDRLEQAGRIACLSSGIDRLQEVTGGQPVPDDHDDRSFLHELELEMACDCGFLTFAVLHHREVTGCKRRGFGSA